MQIERVVSRPEPRLSVSIEFHSLNIVFIWQKACLNTSQSRRTFQVNVVHM